MGRLFSNLALGAVWDVADFVRWHCQSAIRERGGGRVRLSCAGCSEFPELRLFEGEGRPSPSPEFLA